jgi:hypothetical protein
VTVVQYEQPAPLPPSQPGDELEQGPRGWVARLRAAAEIAAYINGTDFVPAGLRGNPAAIAAAILYGDELGIGPMQALAKIAVIKGRPALLAEAQRALVAAAGHEIWFEESTATRAIAAGRRHGSDRIGRITWTLDDAKRAGLAGQPNYRTYPAEMLRARASAALCRSMFPDVIGGMAAAEELEGLPDDSQPPVVADEKPASRRRSRPPVTPTPPPDPQPEPPAVADEAPVSDAQRRHLFALMRDAEIPEDRDLRLTYLGHVIGRTIKSTGELTSREASLAIDELRETLALPPQERLERLERHAAPTPARDAAEASTDAQETMPDVDAIQFAPGAYNEFPAGY